MSRFNRVAQQALARFQVAQWPSVTVIYGGIGLGKSRILSEMHRKAEAQQPRAKLLRVSALAFATEYALAAQAGRLRSFREALRASDFLFLDDLQSLKGKEKTIEELFYTFEHILDHGGRVATVLGSEKPNVSFLGPRLASRFLSGLTLGVGCPATDELQDFARHCLQEKLTLVDPGIVESLAVSAGSLKDVKERIEEFLAYIEQNQVRATAAEYAVFWENRQEERRLAVLPENILRVVGEMYGIPLSGILGRRRLPQVVEARHLAIYAIRTLCQSSYADISRMFNREHSAIIQAYQGFAAKLTANPGLRRRLDTIHQVFLPGPTTEG